MSDLLEIPHLCQSCDCVSEDDLCPDCLAAAIDDDRAEATRDFWDSIGLDGEGR